MTKTNNVCPICMDTLAPDDILMSRYYAPRDWWVVYHLKPAEGKTVELEGVKCKIEGYKEWCGAARFQITESEI